MTVETIELENGLKLVINNAERRNMWTIPVLATRKPGLVAELDNSWYRNPSTHAAKRFRDLQVAATIHDIYVVIDERGLEGEGSFYSASLSTLYGEAIVEHNTMLELARKTVPNAFWMSPDDEELRRDDDAIGRIFSY